MTIDLTGENTLVKMSKILNKETMLKAARENATSPTKVESA